MPWNARSCSHEPEPELTIDHVEDVRDVAPEDQEQLLDAARVETAHAIDNGWVPPTLSDTLAFQLERADQLRAQGWDPAKIPFEDHAAVARGEIVPAESCRLISRDQLAANSWAPVDLVQYADTPPEPATISGLVYPGKRHVLSGEPETLKTWAALVMCVEQVKAGKDAVWIDFEMDGREHAARLRALGLSDDQISQNFIYVHPSEPLPPVLASFEQMIAFVEPAIVVFDAFTGALALHGADENSNTDVERFYASVITPIQAHGSAIILIDHVTKNVETRGRYSIGGSRKLGASDVHLGFEKVIEFGRGKRGVAKIRVHKDRPGHLHRPLAAELELVSAAETGSVAWQWRVATDEDEADRFRPTELMKRVSRYVNNCAEPPSFNEVMQTVKGNKDYVRDAILELLAGGYLNEEEGPRNARLLRLIEPFHEIEEAA